MILIFRLFVCLEKYNISDNHNDSELVEMQSDLLLKKTDNVPEVRLQAYPVNAQSQTAELNPNSTMTTELVASHGFTGFTWIVNNRETEEVGQRPKKQDWCDIRISKLEGLRRKYQH